MYEKIMTALTGLGWLAVLIGAAAVPEDAVISTFLSEK